MEMKHRIDDRPPLDRWRADDLLEPENGIFGMKAIARCLGVSVPTVKRWVNNPKSGIPISKPMGRWFANRGELLAWQRR